MTQIPDRYQIWREVDPRKERYIRIESDASVLSHTVAFRTVIKKASGWAVAPGAHMSHAKRSRFNGKRGGYEFVESGR
jgi:hypothetical protein